MISEAAETLTTTDGIALEARLGIPRSSHGGVVVCHPHPLYGGDMDNPVVVRIAEVCAELGLATLRFNFRGVGRSTGAHGDGVAERGDVEAALARLTAVVGAERPLGVAGYSFGAMVAADVATRHRGLAGVALVAPPLARMDAGRLASLRPFADRVLIVAGTRDEICPPEAVERLRPAIPGVTVHSVDGADHFFFGKLYPLGEAVVQWVQRALLPG
jgi:alpha/beta superfamily hydrolase